MKRLGRKSWLFFVFLSLAFSFQSPAQNVTGIWKGYFTSGDGQHYRLEFQVKQNPDGTFSTEGVSYSWQDDIRFYGKATMTGSFVKSSKSLRIEEIKTVELVNPGGVTCIMKYNLVYSKSGREEFLDGSYLGKYEVKGRPNNYEWGDCGGGTVHLRKVETSDFYVEPFLRRRTNPIVKKETPAPKKTNPPATKKPTTSTAKKPPVKRTSPPVVKVKPDTLRKETEPVVHKPVKTVVPPPVKLKDRKNELMQSLAVNDPNVLVKLYDNGEIDDDTISIYFDNKLLLANQRLSAAPIKLNLKIDDEDVDHELVMVAENLGRIPPNTSLMIVEAGDKRYTVRITSNEQKNALVRFRYEKNPRP